MEANQISRKGDDIANRLLDFAANVLKTGKTFSRGVATTHVYRQLVRAATAGGANYEEARCAESRADFVHKVRVAAKEVREAWYWLRLTSRAQLSIAPQLTDLIQEADELIAILITSAKTARQAT